MQKLQPDHIYHIYNHANGYDLLFRKEENYYYFLEKWKKYILPIADTYAYCLMPNHFHFLIRIKERKVLLNLNLRGLRNLEGLDDKISSYLSQQFSNLFNGYTKAINKRYNRYGSLFCPRFKRKLIDSESYLYNVLAYIHQNPVWHGFVPREEDWTFSSWHEYYKENSWIDKCLMYDKFDTLDQFQKWQDGIAKSKSDKLSKELE